MGKLIIGCGTGRCGTKSFASLMNHQKEINGCHELFTQLRGSTFMQKYHINQWSFETSDFKIVKPYFDKVINNNLVFSDIGPYYLNLLKDLEDTYKDNIKIVILKRNKQEFIKSISNLLSKNKRSQANFFTFKSLNKSSFYKFNLDELKNSASNYYDWFYDEIERKMLHNYFMINTDELNNKNKTKKLFDYLEIKNFNFKVFHENKKPS